MESVVIPVLVILSIIGGIIGMVVLARQNKAKVARSQAMFGVGTAAAPGGLQAVVAAKRTYTWPDRIGYYVTFQTGAQAPVEVEVTYDWYEYLNAGDRGVLSLQGGQFMGFSRAG